jgi:hypothetical membrane protein
VQSEGNLNRTGARLLTTGGIIAPLLWVAALVYSGSVFPGYSHSHQYISELAAQGSPTQRVMQIAGFILPGLLVAGFGLSIGLSTREILVGIGACLVTLSGVVRAAAGVLPCDPGCRVISASSLQRFHDFSGTTHLLTALIASAVWIVISGRPRSVWFSAFSLVTVALAIAAAPLLIASGAADGADVGMFQRFSLGALNLWVLVLAVRQLRTN